MRRKYQEQINDLQWRIQRQRDEIECLRALAEHFKRKWDNLDDIIENHINGKMRVMVVDRLEDYEKGSKIANDIKHIEEVFKK